MHVPRTSKLESSSSLLVFVETKHVRLSSSTYSIQYSSYYTHTSHTTSLFARRVLKIVKVHMTTVLEKSAMIVYQVDVYTSNRSDCLAQSVVMCTS